MTSVVSGGGIGIDVTGLKKITKALANVAPMARKELQKSLRAAGEIVAAKARTNALGIPVLAGSSWSHNARRYVAEDIKVKQSGIGIRVGAGGAMAALWEVGGSGGVGGWRHPLFGNKSYWFDQSSHPYLKPALESTLPVVAKAVTVALEVAIEAAFIGEEV